MSDLRETLTSLAADGHSRWSAHKALRISWHTFRLVAADYPEIEWYKKGGINGRHKPCTQGQKRN